MQARPQHHPSLGGGHYTVFLFFVVVCLFLFVLKETYSHSFARTYLTIIPQARVGYEMVDIQRGA